jgi:hypothetical protein
MCNGLDDDCDGVTDEGCSGAGWTALDDLRSPTNDLLVAHAFEPDSLWIAGGSKVFIRRSTLGFEDVSSACPSNLVSLWSEPGGEVELGGGTAGAGRIAEQSYSSSSCGNERSVAEPPVAMVGFGNGVGYDYVGVLQDGRLLRWTRGQAPTISPSNLSSDDQVTDLHGVAPDQLFAVGSGITGMSRRLRAWALQADGGWREEPLNRSGAPFGRMSGVWALSAVDAIAVGENGRVFRRSSSGWTQLSSDTNSDLTSVRAFSPGRFYVTTDDGRVRQRSGTDWRTVFRNEPGVRFNDLTGTNEDDLWAVGDDGVIGKSP